MNKKSFNIASTPVFLGTIFGCCRKKITRDILSFSEYWKYIRVISMSFINKNINRFLFYFVYYFVLFCTSKEGFLYI